MKVGLVLEGGAMRGAGRQLTGEEQQYAVAVLMAWIEKQV